MAQRASEIAAKLVDEGLVANKEILDIPKQGNLKERVFEQLAHVFLRAKTTVLASQTKFDNFHRELHQARLRRQKEKDAIVAERVEKGKVEKELGKRTRKMDKKKTYLEKEIENSSSEIADLKQALEEIHDRKEMMEAEFAEERHQYESDIDQVDAEIGDLEREMRLLEVSTKYMYHVDQSVKLQKLELDKNERKLELYQRLLEESRKEIERGIESKEEILTTVTSQVSDFDIYVDEAIAGEQEFYESATEDQLTHLPWIKIPRRPR